MSLRDRVLGSAGSPKSPWGFYGITANPFPSANQSGTNLHCRIPADIHLENQVVQFLDDRKSQVVVVVGTQGVGKTNFLNHIETEIRDVCVELPHHYLVRYMADPEPSFDGIVRTIFQELGVRHLNEVARGIETRPSVLELARSYDLRSALSSLSKDLGNEELFSSCLDWLFGSRVLKYHRSNLHVNFRLDTVESRTAVLRDYVVVSHKLGSLGGIFLLLDELEKQAGVLAARSVVRYLSALRAIIDAFPLNLFMVIAVTPDAMLRYSSALPALRSRLEDRIELTPLQGVDEGRKLAEFYLDQARKGPANVRPHSDRKVLTAPEIESVFADLVAGSAGRGDSGVRQREFLHRLHEVVEEKVERSRDLRPVNGK